jgi:hypothetical protein
MPQTFTAVTFVWERSVKFSLYTSEGICSHDNSYQLLSWSVFVMQDGGGRVEIYQQ